MVSEMDRRSNEALLVIYQQNIYRDFGLFLNLNCQVKCNEVE